MIDFRQVLSDGRIDKNEIQNIRQQVKAGTLTARQIEEGLKKNGVSDASAADLARLLTADEATVNSEVNVKSSLTPVEVDFERTKDGRLDAKISHSKSQKFDEFVTKYKLDPNSNTVKELKNRIDNGEVSIQGLKNIFDCVLKGQEGVVKPFFLKMAEKKDGKYVISKEELQRFAEISNKAKAIIASTDYMAGNLNEADMKIMNEVEAKARTVFRSISPGTDTPAFKAALAKERDLRAEMDYNYVQKLSQESLTVKSGKYTLKQILTDTKLWASLSIEDKKEIGKKLAELHAKTHFYKCPEIATPKEDKRGASANNSTIKLPDNWLKNVDPATFFTTFSHEATHIYQECVVAGKSKYTGPPMPDEIKNKWSFDKQYASVITDNKGKTVEESVKNYAQSSLEAGAMETEYSSYKLLYENASLKEIKQNNKAPQAELALKRLEILDVGMSETEKTLSGCKSRDEKIEKYQDLISMAEMKKDRAKIEKYTYELTKLYTQAISDKSTTSEKKKTYYDELMTNYAKIQDLKRLDECFKQSLIDFKDDKQGLMMMENIYKKVVSGSVRIADSPEVAQKFLTKLGNSINNNLEKLKQGKLSTMEIKQTLKDINLFLEFSNNQGKNKEYLTKSIESLRQIMNDINSKVSGYKKLKPEQQNEIRQQMAVILDSEREITKILVNNPDKIPKESFDKIKAGLLSIYNKAQRVKTDYSIPRPKAPPMPDMPGMPPAPKLSDAYKAAKEKIETLKTEIKYLYNEIETRKALGGDVSEKQKLLYSKIKEQEKLLKDLLNTYKQDTSIPQEKAYIYDSLNKLAFFVSQHAPDSKTRQEYELKISEYEKQMVS